MRKPLVIHPFLFALFPVLFLFSQNVRSFDAGVLVTPILELLVATAVLWGLLTLILRNARKAGLVVSLFLLLIFSYGHVYRALPYYRVWWLHVAHTPKSNVLMGCVLVFLVVGWFVVRTKRELDQLTRVVNVAAAVLVAISLFNIAAYQFSARTVRSGTPQAQRAEEAPTAAQQAAALPDIYYIIMDAYGRQDVLENLFGYDNREFLDHLKAKGFYVAEKSMSNYAHTLLCLSSTLNMRYVADLLPAAESGSNDLMPLVRLTRSSEVRRFLKKQGYTVVAFATGAAIADMTNADLFLAPGWFSDEFHNALLDMTPLWVISHRLAPAQQHRRRLLYTFEHLVRVAERPGPKLVFAHLLCPHHPFVFGPEGEPVDPQPLNRLADNWLGQAGRRLPEGLRRPASLHQPEAGGDPRRDPGEVRPAADHHHPGRPRLALAPASRRAHHRRPPGKVLHIQRLLPARGG